MPSPFCVHQPACQGCPTAHLPYPSQLERKRDALRAAVSPYPELAKFAGDHALPCRAALETTGYRLRAKLVCSGKSLGLFDPAHQVVDIPECRILRPIVARAVATVRALLPLPFALLALDVREVDAGVLVTLIVPPKVPLAQLRAAATTLVEREPSILGVAWSEREIESPRVLGGAPQPLLGKSHAPHHLEATGPYHVAVPGGFVQSHTGQTNALHTEIERGLGRLLGELKGKRMLELYAGSGALALRLAQKGVQISAIDSYAPNIERLTQTATEQGLHLQGMASRAEEVLQSAARGEDWDAIIVDPPRRGLSPEVRMLIGASRARCLVLVSCEPRTLARDLAHLQRLGYSADELQPWDLLPQSDAVETLAILRPSALPLPDVLFEDERLIAVNKPAFIPTTPQSEYESSLLHAVKRLPGASNAVPVHRLDRDTSGVCLFAREAQFAEALGKALGAGQKTYLALAQGTVHKRGTVRRRLRDATRWVEATTRYALERRVGTHSLLEVYPEHGRKHQIRRHLSGLGHPVLGDERYGKPATNRHFAERHGLDRTFLHCAQIAIDWGGTTRSIAAPLSADLASVLSSLEQHTGAPQL